MEDKWTLNDIDEMDFYYYLELLSYKANKGIKTEIQILDEAGL